MSTAELAGWQADDDAWAAELEPFRSAVVAALAEAGYPDADVYVENGVMVDGAPDRVIDKAIEVCQHAPVAEPSEPDPVPPPRRGDTEHRLSPGVRIDAGRGSPIELFCICGEPWPCRSADPGATP